MDNSFYCLTAHLYPNGMFEEGKWSEWLEKLAEIGMPCLHTKLSNEENQ